MNMAPALHLVLPEFQSFLVLVSRIGGIVAAFPMLGGRTVPAQIKIARDKLLTFRALEGKVPIPPYTTDKETAKGWLDQGKTVLARTTTGQGGSGITVCGDSIPDAPLFTVYLKKKKEFRVHVVGNAVIAISEKRKRRGEEVDTMIRSHRRGWVFCRENVEEPANLREIAIEAVKSLGLHFGGVDVIWNKKQDQCFVLEVNTAPGIDNLTAQYYANYFSQV